MTHGRFYGRQLFVDPANKYSTQASAWRTSQPAFAAALDQLAAQPRPLWLSSASGATAAVVDSLLDRAGPSLASLVLYAIPQKDLGSHSAAGAAADADAYRAAVDRVAEGLAGRQAIVVLEPDAVSMADRMSDADEALRYSLISYAAHYLTAAGAAVYIDAGSSNWVPADKMAARLIQAGIAAAAGFALNTSGTRPSKDEHAYAQAIRAVVGADKGYGIDTGRNGRGAWDADDYAPGDAWYYPPTHPDFDDMHWLNSPGRGIGARPSVNVRQDLYPGCDWFQWVKSPGGSDGKDNRGHGGAGEFDPYEALALRARAVPRFATAA